MNARETRRYTIVPDITRYGSDITEVIKEFRYFSLPETFVNF
jgi:hypothetical protein